MRAIVLPALLFVLAGCVPELGYGDGALVGCGNDVDCIEGFVCTGEPSRCVPTSALDRNGVALLAPASDTLVSDGRVDLAWRGVTGAASYVVDVAIDSAGAEPIPGSPFLVEGGQQTLTLDGLNAERTHFWWVRSDITVAEVEPERRRFDVLGEAIHVFCPAERTSCAPLDAEPQAGNLSRPFTRIQDGIAAAARFGRRVVRVAGRGAGLAYEESLAVSQGIDLLGGYDATFTARDVVLDAVSVHDGVSALAVSLTSSPTLIEGMRFLAGVSDTPIAIGVTVDNVRSPVTLRNCTVTVSGATFASTGVRVTSSLLSDALLVDNAFIEAAGAPSVRGIEVRDATLRVVDSQVAADAAGSGTANVVGLEVVGALSRLDVSRSTIAVFAPEIGTGIQSAAAVSQVSENVIEVGLGSAVAPRFSNGIDLGVGAVRAVIAGNRISVRGRALSRGLQLFAVKALVVNNLVGTFGCVSGESHGIRMRYQDDAGLFVAHNSFAVTPGAVSTHAFAMEGGSVGTIRNNVVARLQGCSTANEALTSLSSLAQWSISDNLASVELPLGVASANVALTQAGVGVFASLTGPDGDARSWSDNDWRLAAGLGAYVDSAPSLVAACAVVVAAGSGDPGVCDVLDRDIDHELRPATTVTPGAFQGAP